MTATLDNIAFVFPGGGSQYVGMGRDVYEASPAAREVYETADRVMGVPLSRLCFEGPDEELREARNVQPAMLATSMACLAALEERMTRAGVSVTPRFVAGHSMGEYSALVASGAATLEEGIRLVSARGRLMGQAGVQYPGGMAAVMGLDDTVVEAVCKDASVKGMICAANYNCPGQVVISGEEDALQEAMVLAGSRGAKRVVRLPITIGSHSPLMRPAMGDFARAVWAAKINNARIPIVANMTARGVTAVDDIKHELAEQICNSVLWTQSVEYMVEQGVDTFVEIGAGNVLAGLIRRVAKGARVLNVSDLRSIESFVAGILTS